MNRTINGLLPFLAALLLLSACANQTTSTLTQDVSPEFPPFTSGTGKLTFAVQAEAKDQFEIYTLNLEDGTQEKLTDNDVADIAPSWSPDGSEIVYASAVEKFYNLYRIKTDGSEPSLIFAFSADCTEPEWEPQQSGGNKIAYQSNGNGDFDIYLFDLLTNSSSVITKSDSQETQASWSPNGKQIAYVSNADGDFEIYIMDADGGNPVQLTKNASYESNPAWSPDGRQIAFISKRDPDPHFQLFVMNADGTGESQLTGEGFTSHTPAWSPDGLHLAFIGDTPAGSRILVIDMATKEITQVASSFYNYAGISWVENKELPSPN